MILLEVKKIKRDEAGSMNILLIPLILVTILALGASGFGIWAFSSRQEYKNETDKIVATQVGIAKKEVATLKDNEFSEKEKQPLKTYQGPSSYGSLIIKYPKTWSGFVNDDGKSGSPIDGYFHPSTVPGFSSGTSYALRAKVLDKSFSDTVRTYDSKVKSGKVKSSAYSNKNITGVVGVRLEGEFENKQMSRIVLMPLRDKTIMLSTESDQFYNDFENNILPNFSFTP